MNADSEIYNAKLNRRLALRLSAAGLAVQATPFSSLGQLLAADQQQLQGRKRTRSCILLWMAGGPSQLDTFDPKPGHRNAGPVQAISTSEPGIQFSEYLPELAKLANQLAVVRSMTTKEGDHSRATYFVRTGNLPTGSVRYPTMGSLFSKEMPRLDDSLPGFVSIAASRFFNPEAFGPGFLGPRYAPLVVGEIKGNSNTSDVPLRVENISPSAGVSTDLFSRRLALLKAVEKNYAVDHPQAVVQSRQTAQDRAVNLMNSKALEAFELEKESAATRDRYGRNYFGQGCLLARRLVEVGVPFVEVTLSSITGAPAGWDTHVDGFNQVGSLCKVLDRGWSQLLLDLKARGLLETTTIVWMGEFGRTPRISNGGRDHFPTAWSAVLAGGGIVGGQTVGKTSADGMSIVDRPVPLVDFLATLAHAIGVDPKRQNIIAGDRPIWLVDPKANPILPALRQQPKV